MTEVPPERAQALVEYIAHLSVEDFEAVVMHDLPALGFIPPGVCETLLHTWHRTTSPFLNCLLWASALRAMNMETCCA